MLDPSTTTVVECPDRPPPGEPETHVALDVRSYGLTDRGLVRSSNEDQFLIAVLLKSLYVQQTSIAQPAFRHGGDRSYLFIVADGMGGHAGGEEASRIAVESVESFLLDAFHWFGQCRGQEEDTVLADFQKALRRANAIVMDEASRRTELRGMGTTLTLAYCLDDELYVAHAGDSRCYLSRQERLYRVTRDHTFVEEMVRQGGMSPEEAAKHQWRHYVTNAIGGVDTEIAVEVHKLPLQAGDRMLLCSDGLTEMVSEHQIARILQTEEDPRSACERLVAQANEKGGHDNTTVVAAFFDAVD